MASKQKPKRDLLDRLMPDIRGWALIGFFLLTAYTMWMIQQNPALLGVPSFMQFASQLAGGGLLLAAAWLYSAGKRERGEDVTVSGENVNVEESEQ